MMTLERAIVIAAEAHAGQVDKGGQPYILHPLRVMLKMSDDDARIVAVLHDVVEDTDWSLSQLRKEGLEDHLCSDLDCLTRREGETYETFIDRVTHNPLARKVKIEDLMDNLGLGRLGRAPTQEDRDRNAKYLRALERLEKFR